MENDILLLLKKHHLKSAINKMREYAFNYPEVNAGERLDKIDEDYRLMLDFMFRGYKDNERKAMFEKLTQKLYVLEKDILYADEIRKKPTLKEAYLQTSRKLWEHDIIKYSLENYVSSMALFGLEQVDTTNDKRELQQRHQEFMSVLFRKLLVSFQWNDSEALFYESLFLSPTVDTRDICLMVSALSLSLFNMFDILKFQTLIHVHKHSTDTQIRQRALVGAAFSLSYIDDNDSKAVKPMLNEWLADKQVCQELLELQIQVIYCLNAENDNQKIKSDIMPSLLKNNNLRFTRFGIEEKEEDPMDDIFDPGAADRAMEEMENTVQRMMDMQKAGSDIYFGGFSMMKTFPFFNNIANWLMPFYSEHPALDSIVEKLKGTNVMRNIVENGPFCDSDKYSFAFAVTQVIEQLPSNIREVISSPEALGPVYNQKEYKSTPYIRRMYLQDLYRFFRLYHQRGDF
jgi:hypothetical protein